ncbi:PcfJ domain-containing protein [Blastopirellula marina]|uniref:PcfJ-like protein n=1 Tax=Blastopirellula marina TaxID=124 RepID=A0A2S8GKS8_9BACT|nr:PcfJ domain-containing protein [Blastopirellula marina]PQO45055.1 hypothetical protein C5Y93_16100 [Blastopirellula marina]
MATQHKQKSTSTDRYFLDHLTRLGLDTAEQYRDWCVEHGFNDKLRKSARQRDAEAAHAQRLAAYRQLLRKKRDARRQTDRLLAIARGDLSERQLSDSTQQGFANAIRQSQCKRAPLTELLKHLLRERADFLAGEPFFSDDDIGASALEALPLIAVHANAWVRPLAAWKPKPRSGRKQFLSLLHHLFVRYDMPAFFDKVWFTGFSRQANRERRWYVRIGSGENFRKCDAPIPYTKKMAHYFLTAPADATVSEAIRWGQVLGLGGSPQLAQAVLHTRLRDNFANDDFWITVIQWLVDHPLPDLRQVGPIVDYIQFQKFEVAYYYLGENRNEAGPARQPNFSLRGRTADSLLRDVNRWHAGLDANAVFDVPTWDASGIGDFDHLDETSDGAPRWWSIREICSAKELVAEGRKMRHCVASYATTCVRGDCSIWRMEVETAGMHDKALTLEINPATSTIVQARGKYNRLASNDERNVLRLWAKQAGLKLGNYA